MQCFPHISDHRTFHCFHTIPINISLAKRGFGRTLLRHSTLVSNGSQCTHLSHPLGCRQFEGGDCLSAVTLPLQLLLDEGSPRVILRHSLHLLILNTHHLPRYSSYESTSLVPHPLASLMQISSRKKLHLSCTLLYSAWHFINIQKTE